MDPSAPHHSIPLVVVASDDIDQDRDFLAAAFDWAKDRREVGPERGYHGLRLPNGMPVAFRAVADFDDGPNATPYILVEDIQRSLARIQDLGARVVHDVVEVADLGFAVKFETPGGARFNLWQAKDPNVLDL